MKMLLVTVALAILLSSSAFAKSRWHRSHGWWRGASQAFAMQIRPIYYRSYGRRGFRGPNVFDTSGHWVGRDPDPHIRAMIRNDPHPAD